ncbi:4-alpha-glucanotransferase [Draconibacterium halophilum]|uniref:4-alpha-glucanotransferase n=1 Tax=Draconibacterium halophilum TaxID=2706887 RepID=A0A6C0REX6_9BACT|nr:4-alpha-glucanotransferase [Draconibacterium halophilum]QIA08617.1 4-alpha-glucanotransferase [Draconibacterium halophilum]
MTNRKSGILLHITSLPGQEGVGTLGKEAYDFVDFLEENGQKLWQILPLGPVGAGNSPYQCYSAFAGNPMLIDLELLLEEDLLKRDDLNAMPRFKKTKVEFGKVSTWKNSLLQKAFAQFHENKFDQFRAEYSHFLGEHDWWLNDYALFISVREYFGGLHWSEWDRGIKFREPTTMRAISERLEQQIAFEKFVQFLFFRQWHRLKSYANDKGIDIVGDVPLYVSGDSCDVWTNSDIFLLDNDLNPTEVGGVPPDYFSETGQLWGNPVFDWQRLKERNYDWWMARLHFNLNMFDLVRIDHFRGLESFWAVPADEETAINGKWVPAHGYEMLSLIKSQIGILPFIAEDLGIITTEVDHLRERFNLPGMKVLQFAFATDAANKDLPHHYERNYVVYAGTHDNNTTLGWLKTAAKEEKKQLGKYISSENPTRQLMEMASASVADTVILTMQDVLELDEKSRMNTPGTPTGNWEWRFQWKQLKAGQKKFLKETTEKYNR